jgi:hypothetical protein
MGDRLQDRELDVPLIVSRTHNGKGNDCSAVYDGRQPVAMIWHYSGAGSIAPNNPLADKPAPVGDKTSPLTVRE